MKPLWIALLSFSLAAAAQAGEEVDTDKRLADSRAVVKEFAGSLRAALKGALEEGGPPAGLSVCNETAPSIAAFHAEKTGWQVGRTSLRARNPNNAPDTWERRVMTDFEARKKAGEDPAKLEYAEVVGKGDGRAFRYMKAIPTGKPCLACHGDKLAPEVEARIQSLYPDDQATGFAIGDIRGAFTITQPLNGS